MTMATRPPLPPFNRDTAVQKVRFAEDAWNSRDSEKVSLAYTPDSRWRNRSEFIHGREEIVAFLRRKWARELDYRLIKELWACAENRIAVRFAYEWHDDSGNWFRSYGNENWEFDENGLMRLRLASINDLPIKESERKYRWPLASRRWPIQTLYSETFRATSHAVSRRMTPVRYWESASERKSNGSRSTGHDRVSVWRPLRVCPLIATSRSWKAQGSSSQQDGYFWRGLGTAACATIFQTPLIRFTTMR